MPCPPHPPWYLTTEIYIKYIWEQGAKENKQYSLLECVWRCVVREPFQITDVTAVRTSNVKENICNKKREEADWKILYEK
jgi:hypothetical protein